MAKRTSAKRPTQTPRQFYFRGCGGAFVGPLLDVWSVMIFGPERCLGLDRPHTLRPFRGQSVLCLERHLGMSRALAGDTVDLRSSLAGTGRGRSVGAYSSFMRRRRSQANQPALRRVWLFLRPCPYVRNGHVPVAFVGVHRRPHPIVDQRRPSYPHGLIPMVRPRLLSQISSPRFANLERGQFQ
jgi:hypothetical protein